MVGPDNNRKLFYNPLPIEFISPRNDASLRLREKRKKRKKVGKIFLDIANEVSGRIPEAKERDDRGNL